MSATTRLNWTWGALSALTVLSWVLGMKHGGQPFEPNMIITAVVVVTSMVKVRFIIWEFMEVRSCPAWIKWLSDLWLVGMLAVLGWIYYGG